jgi:hypothetical protein
MKLRREEEEGMPQQRERHSEVPVKARVEGQRGIRRARRWQE